MKIPILFIIFNRPEIALQSFLQIKKYKPKNLYIAADGPRNNREGEKEICDRTRNTILEEIDWECNIHTLFRTENIGVDFGVYNAINWMFEKEKWGVIIEDDCILSLDFFEFCEEALPKYEYEEKVVHIIANNTYPSSKVSSKIDFASFPACWGWATWKDKWKHIMNPEMPGIEKATYLRLISKFGVARGIMFHRYWQTTYKRRHKLQPWDSIWQFSIMNNGYLSLMPAVNLAINNGIGTSEGTHYSKEDKNFYHNLKMGHLVKPYEWPGKLSISKKILIRENIAFINLRLFGLKKKIIRKLKSTFKL